MVIYIANHVSIMYMYGMYILVFIIYILLFILYIYIYMFFLVVCLLSFGVTNF